MYVQQRLSLCGKDNDKDGSGKDTLVHEEIAASPWLEGRARGNGGAGSDNGGAVKPDSALNDAKQRRLW